MNFACDMNSDRSSSLLASKICRCSCGKRMSCLKFDFHIVYSDCRGVDCDMQTRCIECADISDVIMQDYVSDKLSSKGKLLARRKHKAPAPPSMVVHEPKALGGDAPPAEPAAPSVSPIVTIVSDAVKSAVVGQVKLMFAFQESLETKFNQIDNRFSQISSSSASLNQDSNVSCQDAINRSFSAPSPVAMRSEHPPDRGPSAPYSDSLGSSPGGLATVSASDDTTSLPRMAFADLLATVQLLEGSGRVPGAFLDTLRSYVIVAPEFDVIIGGALLADSIHAFHYPDPLRPKEGTVSFLSFITSWRLRGRCRLSLRALAPCVMGGEGSVVSSGVGLGYVVPPSSSSPTGLPLGTSFRAPSPAPSSSFPLVSAPPGFSASSFATPPPLASLPPSYPGFSPSIALFHTSRPAPAPPGFLLAPPGRPLAPSMSSRPPGPSLAFSRASSSCTVASLSSHAPGSSSVPAPPALPHAPVPPSPYFPSVSAPSTNTFVSWSWPMVPSCSAPFFFSGSLCSSFGFSCFLAWSFCSSSPSSSSFISPSFGSNLSFFSGCSSIFFWLCWFCYPCFSRSHGSWCWRLM